MIDSSGQLPADLVERFDVRVVPITVVVDGISYREGIDLDADGFFAMFDETTPEVTTSQPSPGEFVAAYKQLASEGADEILSIHVGAAFSGTLNSARLAMDSVEVPVRLIDTGSMSFGVSCCLWEAAAALEAGATMEEAAAAAEAVAGTVRGAFIVQALDFVRSGGRVTHRLSDDDGAPPDVESNIAVMLAGPGNAFEVYGESQTVDGLCDLMADAMVTPGQAIRVGISVADAATEVFANGIETRLRARDDVHEIVRYRVGPSVGAHTGPGTAGGFWYPIPQ